MTDDSELVEMKRAVLVIISKTSVGGSEMILEELKLRLNGGKDSISSEILGRPNSRRLRQVSFQVCRLGC